MRTTEHVLEMIRAQSRAHAPEEACGILLARNGIIIDVRICDNVAPEDQRTHGFAIDDARLLETYALCEQAGMTVAGVYHSHPDTAAIPSGMDKRFASSDQLWVIYSVPDDEMRAWRMVHDSTGTTTTEYPINLVGSESRG